MFGGGKYGGFGESSVIRQTKTIQISSCNLADQFIHQTFFAKIFIHPLLPNIMATKLSRSMLNTFPSQPITWCKTY